MNLNIYSNKMKSLGELTAVTEANVIEERNGQFELSLTHLVNKDGWEYLNRGNVIICDAGDVLKQQNFRIYRVSKEMAGRVIVNARHISFDLARDVTEGLDIKNQSCEYVLNTLFRNSQFSTEYRGFSNIINAQDYKIGEENILRAIGGSRGSVLDTFGTGAEILRDNKNISVLNRRGRDNGVTIEYAKNLTGFNLTTDDTSLITRIKAYAKYTPEGGTETIVYSNPKYVDSPLINNYETPFISSIDFTDKFKDGEIPTADKLKKLAEYYFRDTKCDIVKMNYKIDFIPLSKCVGYDYIEDKISLCDEVTIINKMYNLTTQAKVIKTKYNVLLDRFESIELGEAKTTIGDVIGSGGESGVGPQGPQGPPGKDGEVGDFPDSLPNTPILHYKLYGFANAELSWTFDNKVYYTYELYASREQNFTPNTFNLLFEGQASTFLNQLEPNETWYYKVCAVNTHGSRTQFSNEVQIVTTKIEDLSNYVGETAIGDALIGTLSLDRGWFGELRGNYIDAKQLSVTDGNGKRTLDIDSFGNVNLDVSSLFIRSKNVATSLEKNEKKITEIEQKVTSEAIINTVSKTIDDKVKVVDKKVTEYKQTADGFAQSVVQTAGTNIIKNPLFESGDLRNYHIWGDAGFSLQEDTSLGYSYSLKLQCFQQSQGLTQTIEGLEYGKKYTISCAVYVEEGIPGILVRNLDQWGGVNFNPTQGYGAWTELRFTFTARESVTPVYFGNINQSSVTTFWISKIFLHEGDLNIPFSDNSKEIYSAILKLDTDGQHLNFEDGTSLGLSKKGFYYITEGMEKPYHALADTGWINVANGIWNSGADSYDLKIQLPTYYKNKVFTVSTQIQGWYVQSDSPLNHVVVDVPWDLISYKNATFVIRVKALTRAGEWQTNINIAWLAIA